MAWPFSCVAHNVFEIARLISGCLCEMDDLVIKACHTTALQKRNTGGALAG